MQNELKTVISQAMDASSKFEQEPAEQFANGELSDKALEAIAGGVCLHRSATGGYEPIWFGLARKRNANGKV